MLLPSCQHWQPPVLSLRGWRKHAPGDLQALGLAPVPDLLKDPVIAGMLDLPFPTDLDVLVWVERRSPQGPVRLRDNDIVVQGPDSLGRRPAGDLDLGVVPVVHADHGRAQPFLEELHDGIPALEAVLATRVAGG